MAKELKWQGKTEEEIKSIDLDTFAQMVPTRIRRTLKRGFTPQQNALLKQLDAGKDRVKTHARNMPILPTMIGKTILVYTGKEFSQIIITLEMMGHRLGEFAHSRKMVSHSSAGVGATRSSKAASAR